MNENNTSEFNMIVYDFFYLVLLYDVLVVDCVCVF